MPEITTKSELINTLKDSNRRVIDWFTEISAQDFFTRQGDAWSASDNVDHLVKAHTPIAKALKLPKARRHPGVTFPTSKLQIQVPKLKSGIR